EREEGQDREDPGDSAPRALRNADGHAPRPNLVEEQERATEREPDAQKLGEALPRLLREDWVSPEKVVQSGAESEQRFRDGGHKIHVRGWPLAACPRLAAS